METLKSDNISSFIINNAFDSIIYYKPVKDYSNNIIDFEFVYMNDSAFKILTGTKEKYIGKRFLALFPYAEVDGMYAAFKKTAETGIPSENDYYYEFGEYKGWYRDSVIKYGEGIIVYFRDITDKKLLIIENQNKSAELEKLLKEKELLLKETHHRIKNNLQLIVSMISLQSDKIAEPQSLELLEVTKLRIANIARIHERLYEDKKFSSINLKTFIKEIADALLLNFNYDRKKIEFKYEIEEIEFDLNYNVNICLIINELLTNSIKHAFGETDGGEIRINLKQEGDNIIFIVSDNGGGLPDNFKLEDFNSLGLTIVKSLVNQMDGKIRIESPPGTTFSISISKP